MYYFFSEWSCRILILLCRLINVFDEDGLLPIHEAASYNSVKFAKLMLDQGVDVSIE